MRNSGLIPRFEPPDPSAVLESPEDEFDKIDTSDIEAEMLALGGSSDWKNVVAYLRGRQEAYKHYLPGTNIDINSMSSEEAAVAWKTAHNVVRELGNFIEMVEGIRNAKQSTAK